MWWVLILSLLAGVRPACAADVWRNVTWTTRDGVKMVGLYHAASRPGAVTWVLLHGLGSVKEEWQAFGEELGAQGNGVFIYDARGHNQSTHTTSGETISYKAWQSAGAGTPWDAMTGDLESAVRMLHEKFGLPESKVAVGGASLGANVALVYASQHPMVPKLVLLSPGVEYAGVNIQQAWPRYTPRKVMIAASPGDEYSYATVLGMCETQAYPECPKMVGKDHEHGVQMLEPGFSATLLKWMK
jgi:pimeloyl-ACP methyl ester carboxylesterase